MSSVIGIDPGRTGAAVMIQDGEVAWALPFDRLTISQVYDRLEAFSDVPIIIEKQFAVAKQGLASTFTTAYNYGYAIGRLAGGGYNYTEVTAKAWQKGLGIVKRDGETPKQAYIAWVQQMHPEVVIAGPRGGIKDGIAAAFCLATYAHVTLM